MAHVVRNWTESSMLSDIKAVIENINEYYVPKYICSECGEGTSRYNVFCPSCGASFDAEFWYVNPQGKEVGKPAVQDNSTIEERREVFFKCMEKIAAGLDLGLHFDMVPIQKED